MTMQHLLDIFEEAAPDVKEVLTLFTRKLFDTGQAFTDSFPTEDEIAEAVASWDESLRNKSAFRLPPVDLSKELDQMTPLIHMARQKNPPDVLALLFGNEGLQRRANVFMDRQLSEYPEGPSTAKLATMMLDQKIGTLNILWQKKYNPPPPTFRVTVVNSIYLNGNVDSVEKYFPEMSMDWWRFQEGILKPGTASYQSSTEDRRPYGYTTADGKWQYQKILKNVANEGYFDLMNDADLEEMKRYIKGMNREGGVLIWHVSSFPNPLSSTVSRSCKGLYSLTDPS